MTNEQRPTNASISTMWAIHAFKDLNEFWKTSREMGFQKIELNHQVNSDMLAHLEVDHLQLSSVHEPCPADISTKELVERDWLISSMNDETRRIGVDQVKKSIDLAYKFAAPVVIVHCGTIPTAENHESKLRSLFKAGRMQSAEYQATKVEFEQTRRSLANPRLRCVKKSLENLLEYAGQFNIKIGLENRYHYMDIPSPDEMEELLGVDGPARLGFIYDVGHAQALDRLGFYPHDEWLEKYSSRMLGCHLHDVIGLTDHYAPGLGEIDFEHIASFLPKEAFRTFEILPGNTLAQVRNGLSKLAQAGCIQYL